MKVTLDSLPELHILGTRWRELETRADASFFQSWTWIGSWLRALPEVSGLRVLTLESSGTVVGLGLVGLRTIRRHKLIRVRGLFLNETGDPGLDTLTIEHNGLLLQRGLVEPALKAVIQHLHAAPDEWDELRISGLERQLADSYMKALAMPRYRLHKRFEKPYFTVDLERIRREGRDYLSALSANTRSQLRRAAREYEKHGRLAVRIAEDRDQANNYFGSLRELHQAYWTARGAPGAFATPFSNAFHEHLIAEGMTRGEIQIAEVACGQEIIGYLYNFVHNDVVSNYQGGLRYSDDARLKPGLLAHQLLIEENLRRGARIYDFLMGNHRYKKSLSTDEGHMCQFVVQRDRLKFRAEDLARSARAALLRRLRTTDTAAMRSAA